MNSYCFSEGWIDMSMARLGRRVARTGLRRRAILLVAALNIALGALGGCSHASLQTDSALDSGITKGPVLLRTYQNRAAVMWETETEGPCRLYYGKGAETDPYVRSWPEMVPSDKTKSGKNAYIHKVWIEKLDAGTGYKYRVAGPGVKSETYQFRTAPADADNVRFIIYGDTRTHPRTHRKLIELMMKIKNIDFIVHIGDLVSSGNKYEQWAPQHFEPIKGLAESIPMFITKGNHEGDNGNYEKLLVPDGEKDSFAFDYGPVHLLGADNYTREKKTKNKEAKKKEAKKLVDMIALDAARSDAEWKFVCFHHPSLNFGHHWSAWGHPNALPSFAKAGVDFVLAGHSHYYERFKPIEPPAGTKGGCATYITTGGGGAPLKKAKPTEFHAAVKSVNQFCLFEIDGNNLSMQVIDIKGEVIDRLRLTKTNGTLNKEYLAGAVRMEDVQRFQKAHLDKEN